VKQILCIKFFCYGAWKERALTLNWSSFWLLANAAPTVVLGITLQKINQPYIKGSPTENVQKCSAQQSLVFPELK
jgi:hypothetical protein